MSLLTKEELEKWKTKEEKKELNKILLDKYMPIISLLIEGCEDNECNNH